MGSLLLATVGPRLKEAKTGPRHPMSVGQPGPTHTESHNKKGEGTHRHLDDTRQARVQTQDETQV